MKYNPINKEPNLVICSKTDCNNTFEYKSNKRYCSGKCKDTQTKRDVKNKKLANDFVRVDILNAQNHGVEKEPNHATPSQVQIGGSHYKNFEIQPYEYCHKNKLGMLESNVIKYVSRHGSKNGEQDILKAIHTLELLLEIEYKKNK